MLGLWKWGALKPLRFRPHPPVPPNRGPRPGDHPQGRNLKHRHYYRYVYNMCKSVGLPEPSPASLPLPRAQSSFLPTGPQRQPLISLVYEAEEGVCRGLLRLQKQSSNGKHVWTCASLCACVFMGLGSGLQGAVNAVPPLRHSPADIFRQEVWPCVGESSAGSAPPSSEQRCPRGEGRASGSQGSSRQESL